LNGAFQVPGRDFTFLAVFFAACPLACGNGPRVVKGSADPDKLLHDYKACCTRRLKEAGVDLERRKRWTEGGSTRFLWRIEDVEAASHYVVDEQGEPMEVFRNRSQ
jgi:hypothetical protein